MNRLFLSFFLLVAVFGSAAFGWTTAQVYGTYTNGGGHSVVMNGYDGTTWTGYYDGVAYPYPFTLRTASADNQYIIQVQSANFGILSRAEPSPTPTPTPTPAPTPNTTSNATVFSFHVGTLPSGNVTATYEITCNGTVYSQPIDPSGNVTFTFPSSVSGLPYSGNAVFFDSSLELGGTPVAVYVTDHQAGILPNFSPGSTVVVDTSPSAPVTYSQVGQSINSSGSSSPVLQFSSLGGGTVTTAVDPSGDVHYSILAPVGTGSQGQFVVGNATNQSSVDLTDIKNLLRVANAQSALGYHDLETAISHIDSLVSLPYAVPSPVPLYDVPTPDSLESLGVNGNQTVAMVSEAATKASVIIDALKSGALPVPPSLASVAFGQRLVWTITLPLLGRMSIDLTPYSDIISAFRNFLKFILGVISWVVVIKIYRGSFV